MQLVSTIDRKLLQTFWFDKVIWISSSAAIVLASTISALAVFGMSSPQTWLTLAISGSSHFLANFLLKKNRPLAIYIFFFGSYITLNFLAPHIPHENGLVYVYPLLITTAVITIRKKKNMVEAMVACAASFVLYISFDVSSLFGNLTEFSPGLNYTLSTLCIGLSVVHVLLFSRKWKIRETLVSKRYEKLSAFVRFVNESPLPLLRVDELGEVLLMNASARNLLRNKEGDGVRFPAGMSRATMDALQENRTIEFDTKINGHHIHFNLTPNQKEQYVNIYGEDITSLQEANDRLYEMNNAINLSADGVAVVSHDGKLEYVNRSMAHILGYASTDVLQEKDWKDLFSATWFDNFNETIAPLLRWEHVWRGESISVKSDGSWLHSYLTLTRIPGHKTICYLRDNTKTKEFQEKLIKAKNKAEEATKAKSEFLATMSHEIRTPMNGVLGMAALMTSTTLDETQKEYVDTIVQSGENLMTIINEILDFSKIEAGKMELDQQKVSSKRLVGNVMKLASHRASVRNNTMTSKIGPDVPRFFLADRGRITQVLNNLLSNAIKFTKSGRVDLIMEAEPTDIEREFKITFKICDTGIGIAKEKIDYLFNPFTQADSSTTRKFGGTGLGLAICKSLAKLMG
ncbi:MAG: PAS domain S-box protein, partial [Flavobacteriales bacterium]|nr:PAS domain S-box protein [Flavobacteriales bacterium]